MVLSERSRLNILVSLCPEQAQDALSFFFTLRPEVMVMFLQTLRPQPPQGP